jgi:hypothetical protein
MKCQRACAPADTHEVMPDRKVVGMKTRISLAFLILLVPATAVAQYDQYYIKMIKPVISADQTYQDAFIHIQFSGLGDVRFKLQNKTNNVIEIEWSRASYIDFDNEAHRVIHEGIRFIERDKAPPPTVIPAKASVSDVVIPTDYVHYDSDRGWQIRKAIESNLSNYNGKAFGVLLPIRIKSTLKNYHFVFRIEKDEALTAKLIKANSYTLTEFNKMKVVKEEFGDKWPFIMPEIQLACARGAVFVVNNQRIYGLNGIASTAIVDGQRVSTLLHEIQNDRSKYMDTSGIVEMIVRGLKLCESAKSKQE